MIETELIRNNHLVDPHLHIWGWEIAVYLFLGGITAGLMILGAVGIRKFGPGASRALRLAPFLAIGLLSVGMLALFLDLEAKLNVFRFYLSFRLSSPMSWGSWILLAIYPAAFLFGVAHLADREWSAIAARVPAGHRALGAARRFARAHAAQLAAWNVALGIALGTYTGILLGSLGARALWSSSLLGPLFLASGFSSGAALLMLAPVTLEERHWAVRWDLAAIAVEGAFLFLYVAGLYAGGDATRAAASLLFGGPYTAAFWSLVVVAGMILPFAMEGVERRLRLQPTIAVPGLILIGGLSLRWILVAAGQL